jgi:hypothetical protein
LRDLEDEYAAGHGSNSAGLSARIVAHSIRFGVLSRFTAFVAIDPERGAHSPLDEVVQPVEYPSGWRDTPARWSTHAATADPLALASAAARLPMMLPLGAAKAAARPPMSSAGGPRSGRADRVPGAPPLSDLISRLLELLERLEGQVASQQWPVLASMLPELEAARDAVTRLTVSVALDQLCTSLCTSVRAVVIEGGTRAPTAEAVDALHQAIEAVRLALPTQAAGPRRKSGRRFWE